MLNWHLALYFPEKKLIQDILYSRILYLKINTIQNKTFFSNHAIILSKLQSK